MQEQNNITEEEAKWGRRSHLSLLLDYPLLLILLLDIYHNLTT